MMHFSSPLQYIAIVLLVGQLSNAIKSPVVWNKLSFFQSAVSRFNSYKSNSSLLIENEDDFQSVRLLENLESLCSLIKFPDSVGGVREKVVNMLVGIEDEKQGNFQFIDFQPNSKNQNDFKCLSLIQDVCIYFVSKERLLGMDKIIEDTQFMLDQSTKPLKLAFLVDRVDTEPSVRLLSQNLFELVDIHEQSTGIKVEVTIFA